MKIYTKTGDDGTTSLFRGGRIQKHAPRVQAYGEIDELNSILGVAAAFLEEQDIKNQILRLQTKLFNVGSDLATKIDNNAQEQSSSISRITEQDIKDLESWIDTLDKELPPLKTFILPGGSVPAAFLHQARTVCRRAERTITMLRKQEPVNPYVLAFVNRLSDLLFVLARYVNQRLDHDDIPWARETREK